MRKLRLVRWFAAAVIVAPLACSVLTDLGGLGPGASDSGPEAIAAKDFQVTVQPSSVTVAAGQNVPVAVAVNRVGGFTGIITIVFENLPAGVTANPPSLPMTPGTDTAQVTLSGSPTMNAVGDFTSTALGTSGNESSSAPLAVHVPGPLPDSGTYPSATTTTLQVPGNVSMLRVKAWGAGGGGGGNGGGAGGGGGGGFVQLDLPVTPNEVLGVTVGQGGYTGSTASGGGGGASYVARGPLKLVVAAGGGGGGHGPSGGAGGVGGGTNGQDGADACPGSGGGGATQTSNGGSPGSGGGRGGAGRYNGGDGRECSDGGAGGGGGGSSSPAANSSQGNNRAPGNPNDVDYGDAGAGQGGVGGWAGNDGRIVVVVP